MERLLPAVVVALSLAVLVPAVQAATPLQAIFTADNPAGNMGTARVRVVHASPDAPAVDVLVQNNPAFTNVAFARATEFAALPAGTYDVKVVPAGATSPVVIEANLTLAGGTDYTVVATGLLANIAPVGLTASGGRPAAGKAWVRFLHASPDAPAVDIAVKGGPVLFPNVPFRQGTQYLEVPAGTYDLEARPAGSSAVALPIPGVSLADGGVYTAYAVGLLADVGKLSQLYFVPTAARGQGFAGSQWRTDVDVLNGSSQRVSFRYLWLPRDTDNAEPRESVIFTLEPGESLRHADVLQAAFGVQDAVNAFGALGVLSDTKALYLYSRTYNVGAGGAAGTFGQGIPGLAADELVPSGVPVRVMFLTENAAYRSNLALLNGVGKPIRVMWRRYAPTGRVIDEGSVELPAWGTTQINRLFQREAPIEGAYVDLWTETPGATFLPWGSVLDNKTSAPATILPR
jgi:hypothetical protein